VLAVTAACALGYQALGFDVPAVAFLFAVYAGFRAGHRLVTLAAAVAMLVVVPVALVLSPRGMAFGEAVTHTRDVLQLAWLVAAGAAGEALRQAERRADEAERTREETALRRADEERLHIARELHDSLTHQISVIKVQAEVAVHLAGKRGEEVPEALLAIRDAGREAARELRATLEVLRDDDKNPPRGLGDVPDLVRQESLTNITRHAAATTASVRIDHRSGALVIQIDDDGEATPDTVPAPGVGLSGMRERVAALGGHLRAAPRDEGGFTVRAELPVERTA